MEQDTTAVIRSLQDLELEVDKNRRNEQRVSHSRTSPLLRLPNELLSLICSFILQYEDPLRYGLDLDRERREPELDPLGAWLLPKTEEWTSWEGCHIALDAFGDHEEESASAETTTRRQPVDSRRKQPHAQHAKRRKLKMQDRLHKRRARRAGKFESYWRDRAMKRTSILRACCTKSVSESSTCQIPLNSAILERQSTLLPS